MSFSENQIIIYILILANLLPVAPLPYLTNVRNCLPNCSPDRSRTVPFPYPIYTIYILILVVQCTIYTSHRNPCCTSSNLQTTILVIHLHLRCTSPNLWRITLLVLPIDQEPFTNHFLWWFTSQLVSPAALLSKNHSLIMTRTLCCHQSSTLTKAHN